MTTERVGVCAPAGFRASAAAAGVRGDEHRDRLDVALILSDRPCVAAGVFTRNLVKAAPVVISQLTLRRHADVRAVIVNSGNANACTGPQGFRDALRMATATADSCEADPAEVLVCSTGVIGRPLPMERVLDGVRAAAASLSVAGGEAAARAIMTTDTVVKTAVASVPIGQVLCTVGGMAKGAGMIHPDMATLLAFVTTDACVERSALQTMLTDVCSRTFNCLSIDGDTSTNDTLLLLANGAAGGAPVTAGTPEYVALSEAVEEVCTSLVEQLAADAEGATKSIRVRVAGCADIEQARAAARTVVLSPLVKSAVHGADPNWGRIVAALGRSGASMSLDRCRVLIGGVEVFGGGRPLPVDLDAIRAVFSEPRVDIDVDLGGGEASGRAWGCDLSPEYVHINADYTT
ncbi:MAG: bifunctional glutamate N-acetyltransferase/amino-acid acetyltransferase ArgJ [Candidatus Dormibacteraeota bacterium]|uniref:Arginine biosynthesis bifunctional protein ArgJ n=1 Tax=Candidatus Amunia macphersoniae TaxID=3127014 RepID=A0A934KL93_9BACT|nr:bifunctional glutamate N-acetyltransferase/amino-acid acetyltransferase ArgJ [Candidatus Dormibacteraeota bacterium]